MASTTQPLLRLDEDMRKAKGHADRYVSTCKVCRHGIFQSQKHVWSARPIGLVHEWCHR